jgi:hypothetical protein
MIDMIVIIVAGFLGGMLNAVAGGGSFITLPALIFAGVSPVSANATGTAALLPGYIASAWRFRREIEFPAKINVIVIVLIAIVGGSLGASVLLLTSDRIFSSLIPWLILLATTMFVIGPRLINYKGFSPGQTGGSDAGTSMGIPVAVMVLFSVCAYGGYFNGGLGIILLAALGLMGQTSLLGMNGVKNFISALLTAIAVVIYAVGDVIALGPLLVMGVASVFGGYIGAAFAYRIPAKVLKAFIVMVGLIMALIFFLK